MQEEELSDLPEAVIRPPGICMLTGRKSQVESRQIIKPQTSTYDVVKAPGIVRPLYGKPYATKFGRFTMQTGKGCREIRCLLDSNSMKSVIA